MTYPLDGPTANTVNQVAKIDEDEAPHNQTIAIMP